MAIIVLKEVVMNYNSKGSSVYAAFIDLTKAFDKVNHYTLMSKMMDGNICPIITNS